MTTCTSCGRAIPDGQGRSCSMCYGDPWWGSDGFLLAEMEAASQQAAEERASECEEAGRRHFEDS